MAGVGGRSESDDGGDDSDDVGGGVGGVGGGSDGTASVEDDGEACVARLTTRDFKFSASLLLSV